MFYCLFCDKSNGCGPSVEMPLLCYSCHRTLLSTRYYPNPKGYSLFPYESHVRDVILKAKVDGSFWHQKLLLTLMVKDPAVLKLVQQAAFIVASPSSVWSRLRGRFDIALHLADYMSTKGLAVKQKVPYRYYWSFSKRAFMKSRDQVTETKTFHHVSQHSSSYILVLDDVITTGHTITRTAKTFSHLNYDVKYLTFAASPNFKLKYDL